MAFFKKFNRILYDADGIRQEVVNIFNSVIVKFEQVNNATIYFYYMIEDGEKPENVAHKFYETSEYNWIVLLVNHIVNPYFDWPLSQQELAAHVKSKYENLGDVHHFIDLTTNYRVDEILHIEYQAMLDANQPLPGNIGIVTNYEYEFRLNTKKREIKVLDKAHLNDFIIHFEKLMERNILNIEDV